MSLHKVAVLLISVLLLSNLNILNAQETARIVGTLTDSVSREKILFANVIVMVNNEQIAVVASDDEGRYDIAVPAGVRFNLIVSHLSYLRQDIVGIRLEAGAVIRLNIKMQPKESKIGEVIVFSFQDKEADALRITGDDIKHIPTVTGNLESMLQFIAVGVSAGTGGELTSQYSVRGGNYDENLVYVNGFQIYRPLLIRSGQQEGLTFPNPDMLEELAFSSGGFKAQYGDKMSSVLDVRYKRPKKRFEGAVGGSLLGGSIYMGGSTFTKNNLSYTVGARYKTTKYILNTLDVKGEYVPSFVDVQADLIYDIGKRFQLELIGNYNNADFTLVPLSSATTTGLFNQALRLSSLFEGKEISSFKTYTIGTSLAYMAPTEVREITPLIEVQMNTRHRLLLSQYQSNENERIDIQSFYRLEEIETGLGEDNFGEVIGTLVYGETHQFARNYLKAEVFQANYVGSWSYDRYNDSLLREHHHHLQWGVGYNHERIRDKLKEWTRFDSLGFTLPVDTTSLPIFDYLNSETLLNSGRFTGFVQNTWEYKSQKHFMRVTGGVRANYWTLNQELVVSPRVQLYYTPMRLNNPMSDSTTTTKDLTFKLAFGAYHQPPFYRELRNLRGEVNTGVLAQKSLHALAGVVWDFIMFDRPFKFITEAYYKHQWDQVAYDVENVRIRYYGENNATGYVTGLDLRLNGELVKGMESWLNMSFLRARERIDGIDHRVYKLVGRNIDTLYPADVPKPTDQFLIFSMYFQDYLPKAEWFRVNLALTVGTGMPFGIPRDNIVARNLYRYSPYHRIDIGFSFALWNRDLFIKKKFDENVGEFMKSKHFLKKLRSGWLSFEVFNLMAVGNVASNTWIKDFSNTSYAIPNFLTSRRLNVRFRVEF